MKFVLIKRLKITLLALSLSATVTPAWAVTNITFCDEINQPGSYRVTQDLSRQGGPQCLLIDASNVTIDLQGHTISGDGLRGNRGIVSSGASLSNIEIRNGTVTSFQDGINLHRVRGARVEHMRVFNNHAVGILVDSNAVVLSNTVLQNGHGIVVLGLGALVMDNVTSENSRNGILINSGNSAVRGNLATSNGNAGIDVLCPAHVSENTVVNNLKSTPNVPLKDLTIRGAGCVVRDNLPSTFIK